MGYGKYSPVWSNSLCGARVNKMEGQPLMAMNRIRDSMEKFYLIIELLIVALYIHCELLKSIIYLI